MKKKNLRLVLSLIIILILFIITSQVAQQNIAGVREIIKSNLVMGIIIFSILEVASIVIAPISTLPLLPLASNSFGIVTTIIVALISWTVGSIIAFSIGRVYKEKFLKKYVSLYKIERIEELIPEKDKLIAVTLLKIVLPIDILSYSLGILTNVDHKTFIISSVGIIPGAIYFSYLGTLPFKYQIIGILLGLIIALIILQITIGKEKFLNLLKEFQ